MASKKEASVLRTTIRTSRSIKILAGSTTIARTAEKPDTIVLTQIVCSHDGDQGSLVQMTLPADKEALDLFINALSRVFNAPVGTTEDVEPSESP